MLDDLRNYDRLKFVLSVVLLIILLSVTSVLGFFVINMDDDNLSEVEYDMNYVGDGIVIYQEEGDKLSKELNMNIKYNDSFEVNESVVLNGAGDNKYISIRDRDSSYVEYVELYIEDSDEIIVLDSLDAQTKEIDEFTIDNYDIVENEQLTISATDYISDSSNEYKYEWEFDDGITLEGESITRDFDEGTYNVELQVTNEFELSKSDNFTIDVDSYSDSLTSVPTIQSFAGEEIQFTGSNSISESDKDIISYTWDFDDGNIKEGENVEHTFRNGGNYTVSLEAEDDAGNIHSEDIHISVMSDIIAELNIEESDGFEYKFNASESEIDEELTNITYIWNFRGEDPIETTNPTINHTYDELKEYAASVTVMSDEGAESTREIQINPEVEIVFEGTESYEIEYIHEDYVDVILPNNDLGDEYPEINFAGETQYTLTNIPTELEFVSEDGEILLSQIGNGTFEDDGDVGWVDDGDEVKFNITSELGNELYGYQIYE